MLSVVSALESLDKFVGVAKELARLPALLLPQYREAAQDLYEICQRLLAANENLSRWLYRFLYFDFRHPDARTRFLTLVQEYRTMKHGPDFQKLKFSCGDIGAIYYRNISAKLGNWFTRKTRREEVEGIFQMLTNADNDMVAFTYDQVIACLDKLLGEAEAHMDTGREEEAEAVRLKGKAELRAVTERLEKFSGELADLVVSFAAIAQVPVTLGG
ncbi:hypothetical protein SAMN05421823_11320 [Catalinimonas alkaloidigena]|uniref:Uncharacterized protein n=1 Tax=Catalinimonas alkaloidigena TaxID=1075417 RepID=A0A1G9SWT5_9BACT|nr:hypothetical protein [Catalinimonas alkaloidigena]SDM39918.1 hypothetical protein SAMN05421823_11320 [Catalinimonas alkaloidigena]